MSTWRVERRGFLFQVTAGLTAFPLLGCFPRSKGAETTADAPDAAAPDAGPPPLEEAEAQVLSAEFLMEDYAIFAYEAAIPALDPETRRVAALFKDHHIEHQEHAGNVLSSRGFTVPTPPETYDVTLPDTTEGILRLALTLEAQAVNGYHAFVAQHGEPALRTVTASILACETMHVVALLQALGDPDAFAFAFATELPPHVTQFLAGH